MTDVSSSLSRRKLLATIGGVGVAGAVAAPSFGFELSAALRQTAVQNGWARQFYSLADAGQDEWARQVGSIFRTAAGYLKLTEVRALPSSGDRPREVSRQSAFVAFFEPIGVDVASDLIYSAEHIQYGSLDIFLSDASTARAPARMQAVFN